MDWHTADQHITHMAALNGQPLPPAKPGPAMQALAHRVESDLGLTVLGRSHTFGKRNVLGNADFAAGLVTVFVHPDFPESESMAILLHEAGHHLLHWATVSLMGSTCKLIWRPWAGSMPVEPPVML